jgi:hypothetical protein
MLGCKIFVMDDGSPKKKYEGETDMILKTVAGALKETDRDPNGWKPFRSLFIDVSVDIILDLSEKLKNSLPVFGDRL